MITRFRTGNRPKSHPIVEKSSAFLAGKQCGQERLQHKTYQLCGL